MDAGSQHSQPNIRLRQYQALLEIAESMAAQRDRSSLLRDLKQRLHTVVQFDAVQVVLHDAKENLLRRHTLPSPALSGDPPITELASEEAPAGFVLQTGQPLLITDLAAYESRYPRVIAEFRGYGIKTIYLLPLTSLGRQLGALEFGSLNEAAWSADDQELLQRVAKLVGVAMANAGDFENARAVETNSKRRLEHLRLMLKITTAVVSQLDLQELLKVISSSILEAIEIETVTVSLLDHESGQLRTIATDARPGSPHRKTGFLIPLEGTPIGLAFTSGQAVLLDTFDLDRFPSAVFRQVYEAGYRSCVNLPLIVQGRGLGVLACASKRAHAFSDADKELLCQVANQIAIAVDNALNFERARQAEQQAIRQSERLGLLLEINNAVVSQLSLHELVHVTAACLREVLHTEIAGLSLYDSETDQLRAYAYDFPIQQSAIEEGVPVPLEGSLGGMAFTSGQPIFFNHFSLSEVTSEFSRRFVELGVKSGGCVPLIVQGRKLGVLGVASFREDAFPEDQQQLLGHIANQIAIGVDNALNFERARKAEQEVKHQFERERLMLEINNAVVSILDLGELVKAVSAILRDIMPHDAAGIALYEPELNHLREYSNVAYKDLETFREGDTIPLAGTPAGQVFLTGQPLLISRPNLAKYPADRYSQRPVEGSPKSACLVPLISHGRKLGIAGVSSTQVEKFATEDLELFNQIAGQIAIAVENALAFRDIQALKNKLASEKLYLEDEIRTEHNFDELIGTSPSFKRILKQVETVAPTDSAVLIRGETGTGKELLARAIHSLSARRERALVKLNCAAIPMGLLESELFGHEKGAFTGAISQRIGRFELAHKGTLFLDEVGDIPLELQPKLLRVLQEQEFERLGSTRTQKVDVRLIAATNADLETLVADKKYRSDLYYRLNVFPVTIPPLRERREDIPALTRFFTQKYARRLKKQIQAIPAEAMAALTAYAWPGNVRELEHFIERAVILTSGPNLEVSLADLKASEPLPATGLANLRDAEREHILRALEAANWVVGGATGAAARLGMKRTTLQHRMQKLGLERGKS